jgi:hypothetical protein
LSAATNFHWLEEAVLHEFHELTRMGEIAGSGNPVNSRGWFNTGLE